MLPGFGAEDQLAIGRVPVGLNYDQPIRIEEQLARSAVYAGARCCGDNAIGKHLRRWSLQRLTGHERRGPFTS
jgi:hypothetical protein